MRISPPEAVYVSLTVGATRAGAPLDLSADPVAWAFLPPGRRPIEPGTVWHTGDWSPVGSARVLFDPIAFGLTTGYWNVWLKITDTPELLCKNVGQIVVD